jgi:hypothetical protein
MNSSEFIPNDFEVFRRDRGSDPHGGVFIACRRSLVGSIVHIGKTTEFIGIKVKLLHGKAVIISAAYRPPNRTDGEYIELLVKDITTVRSQYQSSYFILGGDFNLPDIDWESSTVKGHQLPRRENEELMSMQHDLALEQMVLFPTRGQNTLHITSYDH